MTNKELTKIREEKKLSKSDFAKLLGITPMLLGRYEKGSIAIPETIAEKLQSAADEAMATEIEVKKTARKGGRKAKAAVEEAAAVVKEAVEEQAVATEIEVKKTVRKGGRKAEKAAKEAADAAKDKAVATEIEVKKTVRRAGRKAKEAADKAAADVKEAVAGPNIIIQSPMGGYIGTEDIIKKVPKDTANVYVRVDENKLYYVLKNGDSGSVNIWD